MDPELSTPTMVTVPPTVALVVPAGERLLGSLAQELPLLGTSLVRALALLPTEVAAELVISGHLDPRHLPGEHHQPQLPVLVPARDGDTRRAHLQAHTTPPHQGQTRRPLLLVH